MRKLKCGLVVMTLAGLTLALLPAAGKAEPPADWSELEQAVRKEMRESGTPGAAMAIVEGDRVVFSRGFGVANIETGEPVRPETLFRLASTTKMFRSEERRVGK